MVYESYIVKIFLEISFSSNIFDFHVTVVNTYSCW